MAQDGGLIYGMEAQCRALAAVENDSERVRFLVGTQGLKAGAVNQIHELEMDDESGSLSRRRIYNHLAGEVWQIGTSPHDSGLFFTRHSSFGAQSGSTGSISTLRVAATIWRLPIGEGDYEESGKTCGVLEEVRKLDVGAEDVAEVSWIPAGSGSGPQFVMTLAENKLILHDIDSKGSSTVAATGCLEGKGSTRLTGGAWNPHQNCQQYAAINEHTVRGFDVRTMTQAWCVVEPFASIIRAVDFNPNKQYQLATGGDDGSVRFWDIRSPKSQIAARTGDHSHWIWSVKYNAFHDQLILTSSSDGHVCLSCMASISSEPLGNLADEGEEDPAAAVDGPEEPAGSGTLRGSKLVDGLIKTYDDHEDSVYVAEWSSADPWTFASLSYDGRLAINQVPRNVKFRILNLD